MTTFIEFHALRAFPPSNLNRDDLGTPKTAIFGGARRLRISSQCLKRTWRMSEHFRGELAEERLGLRTDRLPEQVLKLLDGGLDDAARHGLLALLGSIGKKDAKAKGADEDEQQASDSSEDVSNVETRTAHLLFLSRQEIEEVAAFARAEHAALGKVLKKKGKPDAEALKKLRKSLASHLAEHTTKNAVDVGLFGRFVTSDEIDTVDAALQVAHGLGTQKVEVEYDYFTAVDDLGDEPGAGHLGESEFASSVMYLYACCDLAQLETNLGPRTPAGREPDEEGCLLARASLPALVRAIAQATPKGKKTGTAPHTPAEYIEIVVRGGSPLSFANAFSKPVAPWEGDNDVMAASICRLTAHRDRLEEAYGRAQDVKARFVLNLRDIEPTDARDGQAPAASASGGEHEQRVRSIDELAKKLAAALETTNSRDAK